ncbi:MAG: hypothetical protein ACFFDH_16655 [Promethearchaeota archaeon]
MVKSYFPEEYEDNIDKKIKKKRKVILEEIDEQKHLDIWDINPSFKDVHSTLSLVKTISLFIIGFFIIISGFLLYDQLISSIIIGILYVVLFIVVFHDEVYLLRYFTPFTFRSQVRFNPFEDFVFWYEKTDPQTIYISNKKDLIHIALRVFQVDVIPENIHSAVHQFIIALASKNNRLSYSYQIIQKPIIPLLAKQQSRDVTLKSLHSRVASIYFSVFYHENGILSDHKLDRLKYYIKKDSNTLKSNLVSNFHHFRATLLSESALLNAVRTIFTRQEVPLSQESSEKVTLKGNNYHTIGKSILCALLILYTDFTLYSLSIELLYIFVINIAVVLSLILIWWRSVLFQFTKTKLLRNDQIFTVNPFANISFYRIKRYPYSLFALIDNKLLIGMKMVNVKYVFQTPFSLLGKFVESLNNHKMHFSYTMKNQPLSYYEFYKDGLKYVNDTNKHFMLYHESTKITRSNEERWLGQRYGMWYSTLTMAVYDFQFVNNFQEDTFDKCEDKLTVQMDALRGAFNINFNGFELIDLRSSGLLSGYLFTCMKDTQFRLNGSHLNYVMIQGARLYPLTDVVNILKKGTETKIAAEFNTPLYLENFLTIGHTVNTEVLEGEVPVGFTLDQLKNLLIVNGTSYDRNVISMKIVAELIQARKTALIFDFDGAWSKLIKYFYQSRFEEEILYFKYGSAFTIDPLISDIPYDTNNANYLEYIYDAYGLAFKKDERTVDMFRSVIQRNPEKGLREIRMALENQNDWEKNPISDSILSLFSDFSQDELTYFQPVHTDDVVASDFIDTYKTVIVDLSVLRELNKKLFLTFVILAKIIHSIKYSDVIDTNHDRFIVVPYIDNFFDNYHLNIKKNYDKIDLFLRPLLERQFGLIFSAHQSHTLHANFMLFFNNIITLRTTDKQDIAMLKNVMNLQELQGTGYYTATRNNTYQIDYLKDMKGNEVLIRRDDINQPFPALIDWEAIRKLSPISYEGIVAFMKTQGYDLQFSERKILDQARKTLFEIDLGHNFIYIEEVINFMDFIQSIDQIGNLYKQKLKDSLKEYLYPKLSKKTQKKEHMKKIRDNLIDTLIRHEYLVEVHPQRAGGGEALRTSYSVGPRYQQALNDYYEVRGKTPSEVNIEILERENKLQDIFQGQSRKFIIQQENLKDALMREYSDLYYNIFKMYSYIVDEEFSQALKISHGLIKHYLMNVYRQFHNIEKIVLEDFYAFLGKLGSTEGFPFSKAQLIDYINKYQIIDFDLEDLEPFTTEIYQFINTFFLSIKQFTYGK